MRIYVGNLSYQVTDDELRQAFEAFGQVSSANVIMDKFSGQSKGRRSYAFPNPLIWLGKKHLTYCTSYIVH